MRLILVITLIWLIVLVPVMVKARIEVIDPGAVTGHNYKVDFEDDGTGTLVLERHRP